MQTKINLKSADHHNYDSSADFIYQYTILLCAYGINDFFLNNNGDIVINNSLKGTIINLSTKNEKNYTSDLVQLKEDFFATIDNRRKLIFTKYD